MLKKVREDTLRKSASNWKNNFLFDLHGTEEPQNTAPNEIIIEVDVAPTRRTDLNIPKSGQD